MAHISTLLRHLLLCLQADMAVPPLKIVGYEGLFGASAMLFLMLPIVQRLPGKDGQGIHEDSIDTWHVSGPSGGCCTTAPPASSDHANGFSCHRQGRACPSCCEAASLKFMQMQMITHSSSIPYVLVADMFALLMYNVSGMCVTGHLGAVFR